jgi:hypothetical protein
MSEEKDKVDKRHPYNLKPMAKIKLNILRAHFNSTTLQQTLDACIDDAYDRHYKSVICEAEKISGPQNAINTKHANIRPQG